MPTPTCFSDSFFRNSFFLLNIISLSVNWKKALSLSHPDRNADWFEPQIKLFHHVLNFLSKGFDTQRKIWGVNSAGP